MSKEDFKFNCSHFIAFEGFRERLHGHNYRISIKVVGTNAIGKDDTTSFNMYIIHATNCFTFDRC